MNVWFLHVGDCFVILMENELVKVGLIAGRTFSANHLQAASSASIGLLSVNLNTGIYQRKDS